MIKRYNTITLFKSKDAPSEANMNQPYYDLVAKENKESEEKVYPGKFWYNQAKSGLLYFSGQMNEKYQQKSGYTIVSTDELDALEAKLLILEQKATEPTVKPSGIDMTEFTGEVPTKDIPF